MKYAEALVADLSAGAAVCAIRNFAARAPAGMTLLVSEPTRIWRSRKAAAAFSSGTYAAPGGGDFRQRQAVDPAAVLGDGVFDRHIMP